MKTMKKGTELITQERQRQISALNWIADHDDGHRSRELARAAQSYIEIYVARQWLTPKKFAKEPAPDSWPFTEEDWSAKTPMRCLVRAGALIAAEIDRLNRLTVKR